MSKVNGHVEQNTNEHETQLVESPDELTPTQEAQDPIQTADEEHHATDDHHGTEEHHRTPAPAEHSIPGLTVPDAPEDVPNPVIPSGDAIPAVAPGADKFAGPTLPDVPTA